MGGSRRRNWRGWDKELEIRRKGTRGNRQIKWREEQKENKVMEKVGEIQCGSDKYQKNSFVFYKLRL